jgi:predicted RNase H-like nuclease
MRAVLGIDAAWTLHNPSGVALAAETDAGWRIVAAESSYQRFMARGDASLAGDLRPTGSRPDAEKLLKAARQLCGTDISIVAVDMPMAHTPIVRSRVSDRAVTSAYASRWCSTHQPTAARPGAISDILRQQFSDFGFPLLTQSPAIRGLIEVYPHPALVELARAKKRLEYKASKARSYWPDLTPGERRVKLIAVWKMIAALLEAEVSGVEAALPDIEPSSSGLMLKAFEDTLDAMICAWIAICVLDGRAKPYGDQESAIWIPKPTSGVAL